VRTKSPQLAKSTALIYTSHCQTPIGQILGNQPEQGIDGCGGKDFEIRSFRTRVKNVMPTTGPGSEPDDGDWRRAGWRSIKLVESLESVLRTCRHWPRRGRIQYPFLFKICSAAVSLVSSAEGICTLPC